MTYTFIAERCSDLPVVACCRVMKVSSSGFYEWRSRPASARAIADAALTDKIIEIHTMSRRSYGSPRTHPREPQLVDVRSVLHLRRARWLRCASSPRRRG